MPITILTVLFSTFFCLFSMGQQSNFVFIVCDDLSFLESEVMQQAITPNLDTLSAQGVNFLNAHANAPLCAPSRASMFTGLQPYTSGYYGHSSLENEFSMNPGFSEATTVFEHLRNNGYTVNATGKIFHTSNATYDYYTEYFDLKSNHGPWPWNGIDFKPGGAPAPSPHPSVPIEISSFGQGYSPLGIAPLSDTPTYPLYTGWILGQEPYSYTNDSVRDLMADEMAVEFVLEKLEEQHEDPFFITAGLYRPHPPFYVPKKYFDMYPIDEIDLPPAFEDELLEVSSAMINNNSNGRKGLLLFDVVKTLGSDSLDTDWWLKRYIQGYLACITYVDEQIGRIMNGVSNSQYSDSTYIIVTSDHGLHIGQKNNLKKNLLWSPSTHIPLIIKGPSIPSNATVDQPISLIDLFPTIVDLAQIGNPAQNLDGYSLNPLIEGSPAVIWNGPDFVISAVAANDWTPIFTRAKKVNQHFSIVDSSYRFNLLSSGETELFDLDNEPGEFENLTLDINYQLVKESLKSNLLSTLGLNNNELISIDSLDAFFYGNFELELNGWKTDIENESDASFTIDSIQPYNGNYSLLIDVDSLKDEGDFNVQLSNDCLAMNYNQKYRLSFVGKSEGEAEVKVVITKNGSPDYQTILSQKFQLTNDWQEYELLFTFPDSSTKHNSNLTFGFLDETKYFLDDIKIKRWANFCSDSLFSAPVDLTKSFQAVSGVQDRVKLKWYKEIPKVKFTDIDAAACDINIWPFHNLDPITGIAIGIPIQNPDTITLVDKKNFNGSGTPRSIFKWPVKFLAQGANNDKRLAPNIRYQWKVRCACDHGAGPESPWSKIKTFNTPNFDTISGIFTPPQGIEWVEEGAKLMDTEDEKFSVYPNPASDNLNVILDSRAGEKWKVTILDVYGRIIWSEVRTSRSAQLEMNIGTLGIPNGTYLIRLSSMDKMMTQRFSISR